MNAPKKQRADVHGWIALDKPLGMTSTHAVAVVRRLLNAKKAGHAGTLDPLASGLLPLAFGEATKTVPYVVDGEKAYRFTVTFGIETDTDDSEGRIVSQSEARPTEQQILAALPKFTGAITQVPPRYSAIKIDGERAYDLARGGEAVRGKQPRDARHGVQHTHHRAFVREVADRTDERIAVDRIGTGATLERLDPMVEVIFYACAAE